MRRGKKIMHVDDVHEGMRVIDSDGDRGTIYIFSDGIPWVNFDKAGLADWDVTSEYLGHEPHFALYEMTDDKGEPINKKEPKPSSSITRDEIVHLLASMFCRGYMNHANWGNDKRDHLKKISIEAAESRLSQYQITKSKSVKNK